MSATQAKTQNAGTEAPTRHHPLITPDRLDRLAVIYVRQSTAAQVKENWGSTTHQREQYNLAMEYGWPESSIVVIDQDLGRSGSSTEQRAGWEEMCNLITAKRVGAVFASNEARLARQVLPYEQLRFQCLISDTLLVVDGRPIDPNDPSDVFTTQVKAMVAQFENRTRTDSLTHARMAKARKGVAVSRLPVGWTRLPDGRHDFDPAVRASIAELFVRFWEVGSVRGLVGLLNREGKCRPVYRAGRLVWKRPDAQAVRSILRNPAYAGDYVYGRTESRRDLGLRSNGHSRRARKASGPAVVIPDHHPAYVTRAEQQRIIEQMAANRFPTRPGRGMSLLQGMIACARCGCSMSVNQPRQKGHRYHCQKESSSYGGKGCASVAGLAIDAAVERIILQVLEAPAVEILRKALADADTREAYRAAEIEATRGRLEYAERTARDRYEHCDARNRLVAAHAEREFERALRERKEFEDRLARQVPPPSAAGSEEELEALVRSAASVPALWRDPDVTPRDRKEISRCLVERVLVSKSETRIDGTIVWRAGGQQSFHLHQSANGVVRRLHADGRTVREIREWLAAGDPETGQRWTFSKNHVHVILYKLGLRPNPPRAYAPELLERLRQLYERGLPAPAIAAELNASGSTTPLGLPWNKDSVRHALHREHRLENRRQRARIRRGA